MGKSIDKITNVLIFEDGSYWLTILYHTSRIYPESEQLYSIVPEDWNIHNGFESPVDAYSYLASLKEKV